MHRDPANPVSGRMHEQPYALAYAPSEGKLEILTAPPDITPAIFLLKTKGGTAKRTYFTHYCSKLRVVANKIVPA